MLIGSLGGSPSFLFPFPKSAKLADLGKGRRKEGGMDLEFGLTESWPTGNVQPLWHFELQCRCMIGGMGFCVVGGHVCSLAAWGAALPSSFPSLNLRSCCSSRDGKEQQLGRFREGKEEGRGHGIGV